MKYILQFLETLNYAVGSLSFVRRHRLYIGFWKYGWVTKVLIALAIIVGLKLFLVFLDWQSSGFILTDGEDRTSIGEVLKESIQDSYAYLFDGSLKYIILLLMEVVIFHICRKTLEVIGDIKSETSFKVFARAQGRMVGVTFMCYGLEIAATVVINTAFGFVPVLDFLEPVAVLLAHLFFLGFVILDNYNEQFHVKVRDSLKLGGRYAGVTVGLGAMVSLLLYLPLLGAVLAPIIASVAATRVMYDISDLHLRYDNKS